MKLRIENLHPNFRGKNKKESANFLSAIWLGMYALISDSLSIQSRATSTASYVLEYYIFKNKFMEVHLKLH